LSKIKSAWLFTITCIMLVTCINSKSALASVFLTESKNEQVYFLNEAGITSGPIFLEGDCPGGWAPGRSVRKIFYINNPTDEEFYIKKIKVDLGLKDIGGQAYKDSDDAYKDFVRYIGARIENADGGDLYSGNLKLLSDGIAVDKIYAIDPKESRKFYFTMWMDENAENSIQGLKCDFDIRFLCNSVNNSEKYSRHAKKHEAKAEIETKSVSINPPENPIETFAPDLREDHISPQAGETAADAESGLAGLLPETGSIADMDSVVAAGVLTAGIGLILAFKKHK
jgi:LPXTG-motif cell wall-anchored protein